MELDLRGSTWNKWDLHIHTPDSLVHRYPGTNEEAWAAFLSDLEALPPEFKVIGVNDYWFLDGYERLLTEKAHGRLTNIALLLPIVELRLNQFGGTNSKLSRVNYHVIFSDELSPQLIREQFLNALSSKFTVAPRHGGSIHTSAWSGVITRDSLEALGNALLHHIPEEQRAHYGTPLEEGFNNLTIPLESVEEALNSSFLRGRYITAVGKTEWADIKWKDGSIADKKHLINHADCVFTAANSPSSYSKAYEALNAAAVNHKLIDCSDAHALSESSDKDRIGNSFTWIKGDPTFSGLLQAIQEFDQRIFVGDTPEQLQRIRQYPSKYIDNLQIRKTAGSRLKEHWFNADLPVNSGLVAIIGNKGSGKSALAEVIGLLGGSPHEEYFSFLTSAKFRNAQRQLANQFEADLRWHNGSSQTALLSGSGSHSGEPRVQHLPQRYLESLCNEVPSGDRTEFDHQLERIIFSHLPSEQRLGSVDLDELINIVTADLDATLSEKRADLSRVNHRIAALEARIEPQAIEQQRSAYLALRRQWRDLRQNPPEEVPEPDDSDPLLAEIRQQINELATAEQHISSLLEQTEEQLAKTRRCEADLSALRSQLERLSRDHDTLLRENAELARELDLPADVSQLTINWEAIDIAQARLTKNITSLSVFAHGQTDTDDRALEVALSSLRSEKAAQRQRLSAPEEAREAYLQRYSEWETALNSLRGQLESTDPETVLGARRTYFELKGVPEQLTVLRAKRRELATDIHDLLVSKAEKCAALYSPLQQYMDAENLPPDYRLTVGTSLVDTGFTERFLFEMVNRQVSGSFSGRAESDRVMDELQSGLDFDDVDSVIDFQEAIDHRLRYNMKDANEAENQPSRQVRKGVDVAEVYDWIFGQHYLSPRYGLLFGGKPIYQLSPGEKGTLLLIFFLLAETDTRPLIIDQPEDNLDNNTVYRALVRCFQTAKSRRQVIIVTHNPNLAVVCDADQVIVASMNKTNDLNEIIYDCGAVEREKTIHAIVDILEGTHPAFQNRSVKYNIHIY